MNRSWTRHSCEVKSFAELGWMSIVLRKGGDEKSPTIQGSKRGTV